MLKEFLLELLQAVMEQKQAGVGTLVACWCSQRAGTSHVPFQKVKVTKGDEVFHSYPYLKLKMHGNDMLE